MPAKTPAPSPNREIVIRGAKEHNLKNVDLRLPRGSLIAIVGENGAGKTNVIKASWIESSKPLRSHS